MPGPWASVGVQVKTPVTGVMLAPAGAPASRLKVNVLAGRSASVAVAVKVSGVSSSTVLLPIAASTGAWLTSLTCDADGLEVASAGVPLSVTRMVTRVRRRDPGPRWASR